MNKKLAAAGLTLGLATGGVAGFLLTTPGISGAVAATEATTAPDPAAPTDATAADPDTARHDRLVEVLTPLVDDGTLTPAQLDAVVSTLEAAGPLGPRGPHRPFDGHLLETAANVLGLTTAELRDQLVAGSTVAEIATAQGVDVQAVIDAVVADVKTQLDARVADGTITQEQADQRLADVTERVTAAVNAELPAEGPFGGRMGGPRGHHGWDEDDAPAAPPTEAPATTVG